MTKAIEPTQIEVNTAYLRWLSCPLCGMFRFAEPPHGHDQPCPQQQFANLDMGELMKDVRKMVGKMLGEDGE